MDDYYNKINHIEKINNIEDNINNDDNDNDNDNDDRHHNGDIELIHNDTDVEMKYIDTTKNDDIMKDLEDNIKY